jgi:hypothetical protein
VAYPAPALEIVGHGLSAAPPPNTAAVELPDSILKHQVRTPQLL